MTAWIGNFNRLLSCAVRAPTWFCMTAKINSHHNGKTAGIKNTKVHTSHWICSFSVCMHAWKHVWKDAHASFVRKGLTALFALLCKCSCKNRASAVGMYTLKCRHLWPTKLIPVCRDLLRYISTGNSQSVKHKAHWCSLSLTENSFAWHSLLDY